MTSGPDASVRLASIVLAAGAGTRFGGAKLTAALNGRPLLTYALDAAGAAAAVVRVVSADAAVAALVASWSGRFAGDAALVRPPASPVALSASLRAGVQALPATATGAFVFLGDMPAIPRGIPGELAAALAAGALAAAPRRRGVRGHPVLVSRALFDPLADLTGDVGAGPLLAALGDRLRLVDTDDAGVVFDVDAPGDLVPAARLAR